MALSIVWFRRDLRLDDNPALDAAVRRGAVVAVFIREPGSSGEWSPGSRSRWWLQRSLHALSRELEEKGARLTTAAGDPAAVLLDLVRASGADAVHWNCRYEPAAAGIESRVAEALGRAGVEARAHHGSVLFGPDAVRTSSGGPFRVFTPFWKACLALPAPLKPVPAPKRIDSPASDFSSPIDDERTADRDGRGSIVEDTWQPGERGAMDALRRFMDGPAIAYGRDRDRPDLPGTSRLSPHLHFGEVGPRRVWHEAEAIRKGARFPNGAHGVEAFERQLVWREFAHHLLVHFPHTVDSPLRPEYARFEWRTDPAALDAWREGRTGFPFIDAGMRELRDAGWMHNRVRLAAASFLVKDLLIHWREGAAWFWESLVDADLANNTLGWQWTAGCGADAQPFFRVFNPVLQGQRFDPHGAYARRWVPEIEGLPDRWIHRPWQAPPDALRKAGVRLGKTYPSPIVDHASARDRALAVFDGIRRGKKSRR